MLEETLYKAADAAYDYAVALRLFTQCAELGDSAAMSRLALMTELGQGTPIDIEAAINWDLKAIDGGYTASMFNLSITFRR